MNDNDIVVKNVEENAGPKAKKTSRKSSKTRSDTDSQKNIVSHEDIPVKEVSEQVAEDQSKPEEKTVESAALSGKKSSPKSKKSKTEAIKEPEEPKDCQVQNSESDTALIAEPQENESLDSPEDCNGQNTVCESETSEQSEEKEESTSLFSVSSESEDVTEYSESSVQEEVADAEEEKIIPPDELFAITDCEAQTQEQHDEASEEDELSYSYVDEDNPEDDDRLEDEDTLEDDGQYTFDNLSPHNDASEKESEGKDNYDPKKPRKIDGRFDIVELFVFTLLAVMIVTSFFFRHSIVKGESMENTLHDGEHLIISDFLYTPERGDIIVCEDHTAEVNTPIVKRVIAIGGDRIKITANGEVYVNGKLIDESDYVYIDAYAKPHYRYTPLEMTVPKGELFVMGDHRNNSTDSRDFIKLGTISEDAVLGKVLLRFYPFNKFGTVD